jgi:hypothetical protein
MKRSLMLLALVSMVTGCDYANPFSDEPTELIPFRTVATTAHLFQPNTPLSTALRTEAEVEALLAEYPRVEWADGTGGTFVMPFPNVDYATDTALLIAVGKGPSSTTVRVDSVVADGSRTTAYATVVVSCISTLDEVNPTVIVAVEGAGQDVEFAPLATEPSSCPE